MFRKILIVLLSAAVMLSLSALPVSADSLVSQAKSVKINAAYKGKFTAVSDSYKVVVPKGKLTLIIHSERSSTGFVLVGADGNGIVPTSNEILTGSEAINFGLRLEPDGTSYNGSHGGFIVDWNKTVEKFEGKFTYSLPAGTYYLLIAKMNGSNGYDDYSVKFSTPNAADSGSYITLPLKAGGTLKLGSTSKSAVWKSSDSGIASVSNTGTVTGKKKGSAYITMTAGDVSQKVLVKVS
ncbi:hypothetical protein FACS1894120_2530 [Clostridia bacterium]|nr:hypothetical protein FACS1894120_2530 [Clostridia bacterium]